jgi:mannose/cellobiose epimerase-like protein (N-acyl-D-glucosamine 2-epimerase family)
MNEATEATEAAGRYIHWFYDTTLPFWRDNIPDRERGGFHELLDAAGRPSSPGGKRIVVHARLIFTFAQAYLRSGSDTYRAAARHGFDFLARHGPHPDGGWRHSLTADGGSGDDTRMFYDHAFILFAMAWYARATDGVDGSGGEALAIADRTMDFIDAEMAHPGGGFVNALGGARGACQQNPHMHLLEAALALYETTGDDRWRGLAERIYALFRSCFLVDGSLREYFNESWQPVPGAEGRITEPGHQFEWCWLLHQYARLTGDGSALTAAETLYRFACDYGVRRDGGAFDEVAADGTPLKRSRRIWPQTEAIKAHAVMAERGDPDAPARLEATLAMLWRDYLDGAAEGCWREHLDAAGKPLRDDKPGTTPYHLAMAARELERPAGA